MTVSENLLFAPIDNASPNLLVGLGSLGLCLIFLELNRPGRILPGASGLALFLLTAASLARHPLHLFARAVVVFAGLILLANVWRKLPPWLLAAATLSLVVGLRFLLAPQSGPNVSTPVALTSGVSLGLLGTLLSRIAFHARRLKAVH